MDLMRQKERLLRRLLNYRETIPHRVPEYGRFKTDVIIPQIKRALKKIEEGTYTICDGCSEPIQPLRLELIPAATHCRRCQETKEK